MAKFYVGQRVRMVRPFHAENKGSTGTITALFAERKTRLYPCNCDVQWDRPEVAIRFLTITHTDRLEPLTPPKQQETITWDEACFDRNGKYRQPVTVGV